EMETVFWNEMQDRLDENKQNPMPYKYQEPELAWRALRKAEDADIARSPDTALPAEQVEDLFRKLMTYPEGYNPLRKVSKLLSDKVKLFEETKKIDWATGELLAFATLLNEGHDVRLSGEDVKRGTFSHRHACLRDEKSNAEYCRLDKISDKQGKFYVYNSLLSEYAVLGFDYGYAMASPNNLVIWEAQ